MHTWNQVWFSGVGWIDIDSVMDDDGEGGNHPFACFALHGGRRFITFTGECERTDFSEVFAQRSWYKAYRWNSVDGSRWAAVRFDLERMEVR